MRFDVVLTFERDGKILKIAGEKLRKFLDRARNGASMSYKEFLSSDFTQSDFYAIIKLLLPMGLVTKDRSSWKFGPDLKIRLRDFLNENLLGLSF